MRLVFADTLYWGAIGRLSTPRSGLAGAAAQAIRRILDDTRVTVHQQSRESFLAGLRLYEQRPDKGYSLVDCVSMSTMRRQGIIEVLTNDYHFAQEGFKVLLR